MLERRPFVGGSAVTEELWPGYRLSTASFTMALMQPKVILDLELADFGLEVLKPPPLFQPFPDGRYLVYWDEEFRQDLRRDRQVLVEGRGRLPGLP